MEPILNKFHSPHRAEVTEGGTFLRMKEVWQNHDATVHKIRSSPGFPIKTFRVLMDEVAKITINNRQLNFDMFFRGQSRDYCDKEGKTIIYPSICRPDRKSDGTLKPLIRSDKVKERYRELRELLTYIDPDSSNFDEFHFSLFQHYNILPTPLIDLTQSLRVAASFALRHSTTGFVYVVGLPYPYGSISHFIDQKILLVKLTASVPIDALTPRYQEGYLVGKLPIRSTKEAGDNLARRLMGKFRLDNSNGKFWDTYFKPMPESILFPREDKHGRELAKVKLRLESEKL